MDPSDDPAPKMPRRSTRLWGVVTSIVFCFVFLETGLAIGTWLSLFPLKVPTYSLDTALHGHAFWADLSQDFGVWHVANARYRHVKQCFDATYTANSVGARDVERNRTSERPRVIVLGDSMMEGYGVADGKRVSDLLETRTGMEHMNFATAGTFAPTQYYLVYKTLAKQLSHSAVLIGLLPANDFVEDDIEYGKRHMADRYRPYFVGPSPDYELVYFQDSLSKSSFRDGGLLFPLKRTLASFTYIFNAYAYAKAALASYRVHDPVDPRYAEVSTRPRYSGYFDYTPEQLARLEFVLSRIQGEAGGRPVVVAILPTAIDFERASSEGPPPLSAALRSFGQEHGIEVVDLLSTMNDANHRPADFFLPCDGHWTERGHEAAANALFGTVSLYRDQLGGR